MIPGRLRMGLLVRLPSGNRVRLVGSHRAEWTCVYLDGSRQRGEVVFSSLWIRTHCTVC